MTDEQVLLLVDAFGTIVWFDAFLGAFCGIGLWRFMDWARFAIKIRFGA